MTKAQKEDYHRMDNPLSLNSNHVISISILESPITILKVVQSTDEIESEAALPSLWRGFQTSTPINLSITYLQEGGWEEKSSNKLQIETLLMYYNVVLCVGLHTKFQAF